MAPKILVVLTSADKIPSIDKATGWYLPEFAHPYDVLKSKNAQIVVASPKGGEAPLDQTSVDMFKDDSSVNFLNTQKKLWENTTPIKDYLDKVGEFDALFYPGGHGPMIDLAIDADSISLINKFLEAGKPVAAVCHGPAVFVNVKGSDGRTPLVKGKTITGFTNVEEQQAQLDKAMPFLLETALVDAGANFVKADEPWGERVETDGLIITGQNPASAKGVGEAIVKALGI